MSQELQGQIRTLLAVIGGFIISIGWSDESTVTAIIGAIMAIIPAVWSWLSKAGYFTVVEMQDARLVSEELDPVLAAKQVQASKSPSKSF